MPHSKRSGVVFPESFGLIMFTTLQLLDRILLGSTELDELPSYLARCTTGKKRTVLEFFNSSSLE